MILSVLRLATSIICYGRKERRAFPGNEKIVSKITQMFAPNIYNPTGLNFGDFS